MLSPYSANKQSGSFVIGRNTAFTCKGKSLDLKQIGREVNVRYVLHLQISPKASPQRAVKELLTI
jgi:TolB-like protein